MTIYDLPDKMVTTLTFAGVTHKRLSVAFSLMSNSKLRYVSLDAPLHDFQS